MLDFMHLQIHSCVIISLDAYYYLILQGLRAFLPKAELLKRVNNFSELKEKVSYKSSRICRCIKITSPN